MNFLAHLYLSGESEGIKVGNFIADHVKGKQYLSFPKEVQQGILLHRKIDSFTDSHSLVKDCSELLRPVFRKYSGVIVDLYFDHFLASQWSNYSAYSLKMFSKQSHAVLLKNFLILPSKVKQFLPFLIHNKRLQSYAEINGITKAIEIMGNYTSLPNESEFAKEILQENYSYLFGCFNVFFQELIRYTEDEWGIEIKKDVIPQQR